MTEQTINLRNVLKLRDKLVEEVGIYWIGNTPEGDSLREMVLDYKRAMPSGIVLDTLYESLSYLTGTEITYDIIREVSWRLAGNVHHLKNGIPIRPWSVQQFTEWVPVQFVRYDPSRSRSNDLQHKYTLLVLAGSSAPRRIVKYWKTNVLYAIARHIGFGGYTSPYRYSDARQFINLRMLVKLEPDKSNRDGPGFYHVDSAPSLQTYNREILKLRLRIGMECPNDYQHECHRCAIGYSECLGAVHKISYEKQFCTHCGLNSLFDPEVNTDRCVRCHNRFLLKWRDS